MNMNISANVQFYVVTHVSHTNQIVYINSYSTHPYQAIKISLFTTPQWPHIYIRLTDWLLVGRFSFVNMSHQCLMTKFGYFTKLFVKFYMSATIGDAQNRKQNLTNAKKTLLSLTRAYRLSRYCICVNTPPLSRLVQFDSRIVWGLFVLVYYQIKVSILNKKRNLTVFTFLSFLGFEKSDIS